MSTRSLSRRSVQVAKISLGFVVAVVLSWLFLVPSSKGKKVEYRFMHCDKCNSERSYESRLADTQCTRCKAGKYIPTEKPLAAGSSSPLRWFYIALSFETVIFLALVVNVLQPREEEESEPMLLTACPHCRWRLRFRKSLTGKQGKCPRCKKVFCFPEDAPVEEPEEVG